MNAKEIPLSDYAQSQLIGNWRRYWGFAELSSAVVGTMSFMVAALAENAYILLGGSAIVLVSWLISWLVGGRAWKRNLAVIILRNEADYNQSLKLKEGLHRFTTMKSTDFPVKEKSIAGEWKPFRVEHFLSNSLRGEIVGDIELRGFLLFGGIGIMKGSMKGLAVPNLLDSSSIIFLKGPGGTLRVLLPSPRATRELLVKTLERWFYGLPEKSHIHKALQEFSVADDHLLNPISHPQLIDSLDASCEMLVDERPSVGVIGKKIQDGVVLATALEVNGIQKVFLPSGFFSELSAHMAPFLKQISEPKILTAVQEG